MCVEENAESRRNEARARKGIGLVFDAQNKHGGAARAVRRVCVCTCTCCVLLCQRVRENEGRPRARARAPLSLGLVFSLSGVPPPDQDDKTGSLRPPPGQARERPWRGARTDNAVVVVVFDVKGGGTRQTDGRTDGRTRERGRARILMQRPSVLPILRTFDEGCAGQEGRETATERDKRGGVVVLAARRLPQGPRARGEGAARGRRDGRCGAGEGGERERVQGGGGASRGPTEMWGRVLSLVEPCHRWRRWL